MRSFSFLFVSYFYCFDLLAVLVLVLVLVLDEKKKIIQFLQCGETCEPPARQDFLVCRRSSPLPQQKQRKKTTTTPRCFVKSGVDDFVSTRQMSFLPAAPEKERRAELGERRQRSLDGPPATKTERTFACGESRSRRTPAKVERA